MHSAHLAATHSPRVWVAVVVAAMVVASCGSIAEPGRTNAPGDSPPLEGDWVLESFGPTHDPIAVSIDRLTTASFSVGRLTGAAPCNRYNAPYTSTADTVDIGLVAMTRALCGDADLDAQEIAFIDALGEAHSYEVESGRLIVGYGDGLELRFRRA